MQDGRKAFWSFPYVSVTFFPSLKQNFIAYRSYKVSSRRDCIFEIYQLWQSGFSRVYSNSCCSCSFEAEIIKIGLSSYKIYSNNIVNFQESTTILNACTKKSGNLLEAPRIYTKRIILCLLSFYIYQWWNFFIAFKTCYHIHTYIRTTVTLPLYLLFLSDDCMLHMKHFLNFLFNKFQIAYDAKYIFLKWHQIKMFVGLHIF